MITRDVSQLLVVPAFVHDSRFAGCGAGPLNWTCSTVGGIEAPGSTNLSPAQSASADCAIYFPGFVIDRLGLRETYRSLLLAPNAYGDVLSTDENARSRFQGISLGLQHTSATGGTWADYSTEDWLIHAGLWNQTTATSTAAGFYAPVQRDAADVLGEELSTTTSTAAAPTGRGDPTTSTGISYYVGPGAVFDLGGAKRYIRCLMRPHFDATGSGAVGTRIGVTAIFGEPDYARPNETAVKRILVTTPCAT